MRRTTVDGLSWQALRGSGQSALTVLLDGEPVLFSFFGETDLEEIPIPLSLLDRAVFCPTPGPAARGWTSGPTLFLWTRSARAGSTLAGSWRMGNEVGDPGPYRYTDRATPNVDKYGPDTEFALRHTDTLRMQGGEATFRALRLYATDPAAAFRNRAVTTRPANRQRVITAATEGYAQALSTQHTVRLAGLYAADLWFFEPAGRELPVRRLGASVSLHSDARRAFSYRLAARFQRLSDEDSRLPGFRPDWQQRILSAALHGRRDKWRYGAAWEQTDAAGPGLDRTTGFALTSLYALRAWPLPLGYSQTAFHLSSSGGDVGGDAQLLLRWIPSSAARPARAATLALGISRQLPEQNLDYAFWSTQGYRGLELTTVRYHSAPPRPYLSAYVTLSPEVTVSPSVQVSGRATVQTHRGLTLERPSFRLDDEGIAPTGVVTAVPDAAGSVADGTVALKLSRGMGHLDLSYSAFAPFGGTAAFLDAQKRVPQHRARAGAALRPDPGFSLHVAVEAQSAARWPGYTLFDGAASRGGYRYTDGTPNLWLLDVTATKRLWNRRAQVTLLFRNVLNSEERYHPLGAALDFRLFARFTAQLQGLPVVQGASTTRP